MHCQSKGDNLNEHNMWIVDINLWNKKISNTVSILPKFKMKNSQESKKFLVD